MKAVAYYRLVTACYCWAALLSFSCANTSNRTCDALLQQQPQQQPSKKTHRYFAFGSNLLPSTMTSLRRVEPLNATAAVLPDYRLLFLGNKESRLEPSAAFVVPTTVSTSFTSSVGRETIESPTATPAVVHGVVYELTSSDFVKVGATEGVPFGYRWQACRVYPYQGNNEQAGVKALEEKNEYLEAYTLIPGKMPPRDDFVPPSPSYLGLIQEGATIWKLDKKYQEQLAAYQTADNLLIPQGLSGLLLRTAELFSRR